MGIEFRSGLACVEAVTELLQRIRIAHPAAGLYEAAEIQFWWSRPRSTDDVDQLVWFDDSGRPEAAAFVTDFSDGSSLLYQDPTLVVSVLPDTGGRWLAQVIDRARNHFADLGFTTVEMELDRIDETARSLLFQRGFAVKGDGLVECQLGVADRPEVSPLADGYRLTDRRQSASVPHHMARRGRPDPQPRLNQVSLYRPDLDLVVVDGNDTPAAYGMFWFDPTTATGVVEPMRTLDGHSRRGLARHILSCGIERLADVGAKRLSVGYEPGNPASGPLYRSVGFEPIRTTDVVFGRL